MNIRYSPGGKTTLLAGALLWLPGVAAQADTPPAPPATDAPAAPAQVAPAPAAAEPAAAKPADGKPAEAPTAEAAKTDSAPVATNSAAGLQDLGYVPGSAGGARVYLTQGDTVPPALPAAPYHPG